ncbi:MAG: hypothetical protein ACMVY4_15835 [Minwuia sp.]|uniref:hypothetical protein n=1 Tax=Minwuia sp. TaxID=2493630 RepID=UPI003A8AD77C
MPVAVEQDQNHPAGVARLRLANAGGLDPATLEVKVTASQNGADRHLDPSRSGAAAWAPAERWFHGASAEAQGPSLAVELGPAATWHLKPYQPYAVAFRDASGKAVEDRMIWIDMRLPSNPPPPAPESGPASAGYPEQPRPDPESEAAPKEDPLAAFAAMEEAAEPEPELTAEEPVAAPEPEEKKAGAVWWLIAALLLVAIIGGGIWFYLLYESSGEPQEAEAPAIEKPAAEQPATEPPATTASVPLTIEGARAYISQQKPEAADALAEAERFAEADQHQAAFLLNKYAAQQGDGKAQFRMARYYDPESHDPTLGVISEPDPTIAADWYQQAAEGGETPAMLRLGELLKEGEVSWPDAPERAVFWLRKAAEAGSEKAKELLQ